MSLLSRNILITLSAYCLICAFVSALPLDESTSNKDLAGLLRSELASKQQSDGNTNAQADGALAAVNDADDLDLEASAAADTDEQRTLASYYLALYLQELLSNGQLEESSSDDESRYRVSSGGKLEKRASPRATLIKKESPFEQQRNKEMRRQQAARWDIGFGKRAYKPKAFMDALYGKRSNLFYKQTSPKLAYGRKQQWDIQYGRR